MLGLKGVNILYNFLWWTVPLIDNQVGCYQYNNVRYENKFPIVIKRMFFLYNNKKNSNHFFLCLVIQ